MRRTEPALCDAGINKIRRINVLNVAAQNAIKSADENPQSTGKATHSKHPPDYLNNPDERRLADSN